VRESDIELAISTITATLMDDPRILKTPAPIVKVSSLADDAATLTIWAWCDPANYQNVAADEYLRLSNRLIQAEVQTL
jgi:small-conductance mechanosensitive channel